MAAAPESTLDAPIGDTRRSKHHRAYLGLAIAVIVIACVLEVRSDQRVALFCLPQFPLPESCGSRVVLGINCPGCGLTRSLVHLAHGRLAQSLEVQPVGWVIALAILLQIPYRLTALWRGVAAPLGHRFPQVFGLSLVAVLIGTWLVRMILPLVRPN
ncbi:MAG: DUF2752 domain-containing protein [Planctomycetales bacterium]